MKELKSINELEQVWKHSEEKPTLLFKHSTTCPISAGAFKEYKEFLDGSGGEVNSYTVKVIENRDVSNKIAEETGIKHESPQIFLLKNGDVRWNTSHSRITKDAIKEALRS